jgi:hypothetical protein
MKWRNLETAATYSAQTESTYQALISTELEGKTVLRETRVSHGYFD